eukprot:1146520-Pelagomonas_calceolata.AAC.8
MNRAPGFTYSLPLAHYACMRTYTLQHWEAPLPSCVILGVLCGHSFSQYSNLKLCTSHLTRVWPEKAQHLRDHNQVPRRRHKSALREREHSHFMYKMPERSCAAQG